MFLKMSVGDIYFLMKIHSLVTRLGCLLSVIRTFIKSVIVAASCQIALDPFEVLVKLCSVSKPTQEKFCCQDLHTIQQMQNYELSIVHDVIPAISNYTCRGVCCSSATLLYLSLQEFRGQRFDDGYVEIIGLTSTSLVSYNYLCN